MRSADRNNPDSLAARPIGGGICMVQTFVFALALLLVASPAWAAIALLKSGGEPIRGFLVRQDAEEVVLDVPRADGSMERRTLRRIDLDALLITVPPERLAALVPDDPKAYRNFAEELAEKKVDPEARAAALRLYLLAAYLDPKEFGRGSLLGMIALARSPAEEKKFRAMAFLLDGEHDRGLLKEASATPAIPAGESALVKEDRNAILRAVQLYRQGKLREAATIIRPTRLRPVFDRLEGPIDYDAFLAACNSPGRATPKADVLAKTLAIELALAAPTDGSPAAAPMKESAEHDWSAAAKSGDLAPAPALRLEYITEFDPRLSVFRDGKWQAPSAAQ